MTVIKSIENSKFALALVQSDSGAYHIMYQSERSASEDLDPIMSEAMQDYNMASYAFDRKLIELEGN